MTYSEAMILTVFNIDLKENIYSLMHVGRPLQSGRYHADFGGYRLIAKIVEYLNQYNCYFLVFVTYVTNTEYNRILYLHLYIKKSDLAGRFFSRQFIFENTAAGQI